MKYLILLVAFGFSLDALSYDGRGNAKPCDILKKTLGFELRPSRDELKVPPLIKNGHGVKFESLITKVETAPWSGDFIDYSERRYQNSYNPEYDDHRGSGVASMGTVMQYGKMIRFGSEKYFTYTSTHYPGDKSLRTYTVSQELDGGVLESMKYQVIDNGKGECYVDRVSRNVSQPGTWTRRGDKILLGKRELSVSNAGDSFIDARQCSPSAADFKKLTCYELGLLIPGNEEARSQYLEAKKLIEKGTLRLGSGGSGRLSQ